VKKLNILKKNYKSKKNNTIKLAIIIQQNN